MTAQSSSDLLLESPSRTASNPKDLHSMICSYNDGLVAAIFALDTAGRQHHIGINKLHHSRIIQLRPMQGSEFVLQLVHFPKGSILHETFWKTYKNESQHPQIIIEKVYIC